MIAVGTYIIGTSIFPLVATSNDMGNTWIYTTAGLSPLPPAAIDKMELFSSSCSGTNCIASGYYNGTPPYNSYPVVAQSSDGGNTWGYQLTNVSPVLPSDFLQGQLTTTSCSGINCVAAGDYYNLSVARYPLLASSHDSGNTWNYRIDSSNINTPALPSDFTQGIFTTTSCSGLNCIAAGQYNNLYPIKGLELLILLD